MINIENDLVQSILEFPKFTPQQQEERFLALQQRLPPAQLTQALDRVVASRSGNFLSDQDLSIIAIFYRRISGSPIDLLIRSFREGNLLLVQRLIQIDYTLEELNLALAWAIQANQPAIVEFLERKGAFLSDQTIDRFYSSLGTLSPKDASMLFFEYCIKKNNENGAFLFLKRSGYLEDPDHLFQTIKIAIHSVHVILVRKLLELCQNKEAVQKLLSPFVSAAILEGDCETLQNLLYVSNGLFQFDMNQKLENGSTPLHFVLVNMPENVELIELIVLMGGNIEIENEHGLTPLQYSAFHGHEAALNNLLELGAEPNRIDAEDSTALHYLGYGLGLNYQDERVYESMLKKLVAGGGNLQARNHFYETAEAAKLGPDSASSLEMVLLSAYGIPNGSIEMGIDNDYPITEQFCDELEKMGNDQFSIPELIEGIIPEDYRGGDYAAIYQRISEGKLTILSTGWKGHNIYLVFFENQLVICNRASRPVPTLLLCNVNANALSPPCIENFHRHLRYAEPSVGQQIFYEILLKALKVTRSEFQVILGPFANKDQKIGNCRMTLKSAIRAAAILLMYKNKKEKEPVLFQSAEACREQFQQCCVRGRKFSKELSNNHRTSLLDLYKWHPRRKEGIIQPLQSKIEFRLRKMSQNDKN